MVVLDGTDGAVMVSEPVVPGGTLLYCGDGGTILNTDVDPQKG